MTDVRYFTGSGHAQEIALACAEALGEPALPLREPLRKNAVLLLVFPVYCERVPPPVAAYLKACGAERAVFIAAYGGMSYGRALYDAQTLFRGKVIAAAYVPTEHAYTQDGYPFEAAALVPLFEKVLSGEGTAVLIPKGRRHLLSGAPGLRSRLGVRLVRSSRCSGCGVCERVCPMHAMRAGKPNSRCIRCLSCVRTCPEGALSFRLSPLLRAYLRRKRKNETRLFL